MKTRKVLILMPLFVLSACSNTSTESLSEETIRPETLFIEKSIIANHKNNNATLTADKNAVESPSGLKKIPTQQVEVLGAIGGLSSLEEKAKTAPVFMNEEPVSISVDSMAVVKFIHYVFDEVLGLNYVISSKVEKNKSKISLNLTDAVDKSTLYTTARTLLDENDIAMWRKDNIIYFQKKEKNKRYSDASIGIGNSPSDIPKVAGEIVQIIPYVHTNSRSLSSVIKKLTAIDVAIDAKRKLVTVKGSESEISEVMRVLNMLDVASAANKEIRLINLAYISPDSLVSNLEELLINDGYEVGKNQDITIVPVSRLNAVVVYAVSLKAVERVELWSKKLDIAIAGNEPQFYIYRPLYNNAKDIQSSIGNIINSILMSGSSSVVANNLSQSTNAAKVKTGTTQRSAEAMTVDENQNALIFYTTSDKYRKILSLLEKLDKLPGQVILDIVIAEVVLGDEMGAGIDWNYSSLGQGASPYETASILPGSLNIFGLNGDWTTAMEFVDKQTETRVLAKPFLIVKDGESATINSGNQIPTLTATSTSENDNITNTVSYVTTGIQVGVTPSINAKGLINLNISMSSSNSVDSDSSDDDLTPTITSNSISTNIFSGDGQTVALGGLISENLVDTENDVPFFGEIPLLGRLFSSESEKYARTELIMLITTRIVKEITDIDEFHDNIMSLYNFPLAEDKQKVSVEQK